MIASAAGKTVHPSVLQSKVVDALASCASVVGGGDPLGDMDRLGGPMPGRSWSKAEEAKAASTSHRKMLLRAEAAAALLDRLKAAATDLPVWAPETSITAQASDSVVEQEKEQEEAATSTARGTEATAVDAQALCAIAASDAMAMAPLFAPSECTPGALEAWNALQTKAWGAAFGAMADRPGAVELSARRGAAFSRIQSILSEDPSAWAGMDPMARRTHLSRRIFEDESVVSHAASAIADAGLEPSLWSTHAAWLEQLQANAEEWPGEAEGGDFSGVGARTGPGVHIEAGDVVRRGPSWQWGSADGGEGGLGDVSDVTEWHGQGGAGIKVRWRRTGNIEVHRWGFEGAWDLEILPSMKASGGRRDSELFSSLGHAWSPDLRTFAGCASVVFATGEHAGDAEADPVLELGAGPASGSGAAAALLASASADGGAQGHCSATKGAESTTGASTVWTAMHPSYRCDDDGRALMLASGEAELDMAVLQRQSSIPEDGGADQGQGQLVPSDAPAAKMLEESMKMNDKLLDGLGMDGIDQMPDKPRERFVSSWTTKRRGSTQRRQRGIDDPPAMTTGAAAARAKAIIAGSAAATTALQAASACDANAAAAAACARALMRATGAEAALRIGDAENAAAADGVDIWQCLLARGT